jgi:hyperosmotically inducible periplasmic protein
MQRFAGILLGPTIVVTAGLFEPAFVTKAASEPISVPSVPSVPSINPVPSMPSMPVTSTEKNVLDYDNATPGPPDQAQGSANDMALTRRIREALTADKSISPIGQNIKIVTLKGRTTLRGPVRDAKEQGLIVGKVSTIVGPFNVVNQLEARSP